MSNAAALQKRVERSVEMLTECGCWIWMGALSSYRYGNLRHHGKDEKAHRVSWLAYRGEIPEGAHVLHRCDVTFCVNPDHLFLGSHSINMQDKERKGRGNHACGLRNARYTKPHRTCRGDRHPNRMHPENLQGEKNGRAVLTVADVLEIRKSVLPGAVLGARYGISKNQANRIKARKAWAHI